MKEQKELDFARIKSAIEYIDANYTGQPSLDEVAAHVNLSPFHFQRLFTEWSGVSPKQFLRYASVGHAKSLLREGRATLSDAAFGIGLSGTGRLHDMFVRIEGMTPGEYKNGGAELSIDYSFADSPFGEVLAASTGKGICHVAFADNREDALRTLRTQFPNAVFRNFADAAQRNAVSVFTDWRSDPDMVKLHIRGTEFQLKVWEALLKIPAGKLVSYGDIAARIDSPDAVRAVGTAIGQNPVAYIIPCHRVIRSTGAFGGYMWGLSRKKAIIGREGAAADGPKHDSF